MPTPLGRLRRRSEFLRVAAARRKSAAKGLVLQAAPRDAAGGAITLRIGFTVSKRVGKAVARNRAKRRLRAAAAAIMPLHAAADRDYVIIGRAATLRRPYPALVSDLETALRRLGAWCDRPGSAPSLAEPTDGKTA